MKVVNWIDSKADSLTKMNSYKRVIIEAVQGMREIKRELE